MVASARESGVRPRTGGIVFGFAATISAAVSLALLSAGGAALWTHASKRDTAGFYTTSHSTISTPTAALVARGLEIDGSGVGWALRHGRLATLRIDADATDGGRLFVGIGTRSEVTRYLGGLAYDEITDFDVDPFTVTRSLQAGASTGAAPPGGRPFWAAKTSGPGDLTVRWPVTSGDWAAVVMNEDGSRGVHASVSVGASVPVVLWIGIGLTIAGLLTGFVALTAALTARRRRQISSIAM